MEKLSISSFQKFQVTNKKLIVGGGTDTAPTTPGMTCDYIQKHSDGTTEIFTYWDDGTVCRGKVTIKIE